MIEQVSFWHWLVLAVALMILEVFAPGAFFLWLGISAAAVGGIVYMVPDLGWENQLLVFSVLSVVSIIVWRKFFKTTPEDTDQPSLNRRGHQYIGRVFTLDEAIHNGTGKIRVDDSTWKVRGEDSPEGTQVEVTGLDGTVLLVKRHQL